MINTKIKKERIISLLLVFSIIISTIASIGLFATYANETEMLTEIPEFKKDWSYTVNTTVNTLDALDSSGWGKVSLPAGNAGSSSPLCRDYIQQNGTAVGTSGSTRNLVFQKVINITGLNNYAGFAMDAIVEDGAVVFVNDVEAIRFNAYHTGNNTTSQSGGTRTFGYDRRYVVNDPLEQVNKSTFEKMFINKSLFNEGANVITVVVLQDTATSSDILFDGMMYSISNDYTDITPSGTSVSYGDEWLWIKNDPGNDSWMSDEFISVGAANTTAYKSYGWRVNNSSFGYDTENNTGKTITTQIPHNIGAADPNHPTNNVYLRRAIDISSKDKILNAVDGKLTMKIDRIRNIAVYINGVEVLATTNATNNANHKDTVEIPVDILKDGRNIICVDMRHTNATSTSIYFDMEFEIELDDDPGTGNLNELNEIPNFRKDWSYTVNTVVDTVDTLDSSGWEKVSFPAGNAGSSSPLCRDYIQQNGTAIGTSGSIRNLVFQKTINIRGLSNYAGFAMDAIIDDSAVVFVNGVEVLRFNAYHTGNNTTSQSGGTRTFGYERRYTINDPLDQINKSTFEKLVIDKSLFIEGDNLITIVVLQDSATSSDILFDGMIYTIPGNFTDTLTPSGSTINYGDEWLWIKNDCEESWLSENFIPVGVEAPSSTYNSNGWRIGKSSFGFDVNNNTGTTIATQIPHNNTASSDNAQGNAANSNTSTNNVYLRRVLNIASVSDLKDENNNPLENIKMEIARIRNIAVYINGTEVYRTNNATNNTLYNDTVQIPVSLLKAGRNIVSVDLINTSPGATSIYFDLRLVLSKEFSAKKFVMTPGANETEMGFLWHTSYESDPDNIYFVPNTADEDKYIIQKQGQINGSGGRFHDGNAKSIYKMPLNTDKEKAVLYIDICQNYTIELSGDGTTWNDVYAFYADTTLVNTGETGEQNRHKATFDLTPYLKKNCDYIYFRIGDQTAENGWGGIVYSVQFIMGDVEEMSGAAVQIVKSSDYANDGFDQGLTFTGTMTVLDGNWYINKVTATDLERETEYTYRYGNTKDNLWSDSYTFTTGGVENKVVLVGDPTIGGDGSTIAKDREGFNDCLNAAAEQVPDARFILSIGDSVDKDRDAEYDALFSMDQFKRLPYAPINGNHDRAKFKYHFNFPNLTELGKTEAASNYYFSYGDTLYIMLNSLSQNIAEHRQTMEEATAFHPDAKWRIVVTHLDVYGAGPHASGRFDYYRNEIIYLRNNLTPVFDEFGIDVVFNGHDHSYARSHFMKNQQAQMNQLIDNDGAVVNPNGTLYITATCSSNSRYYSPEVNDNMYWVNKTADFQEAQFTELDIKDDTFTITTYVASDLNVVDTVTIKKTEKSSGATVNPPTISGTPGANSITVSATAPDNGQEVEYAVSTTNTAPVSGWQDNGSFTGLNDYTEYYFFARAKENAEYKTGAASSGVAVHTADGTPPAVTITIKGNGWSQFVNKVTFGLFARNNVDVTITASDSGSGVKTVEYYKSETDLPDTTDWETIEWTTGTSTDITANWKGIVYARITDNANNITVISSDGLVVFTDSETTVTGSFSKDSTSDLLIAVNKNGNTVKEITYNGNTVAAENYTLGANSIVFKNSYLKTLPDGTAEFIVTYNPYGITDAAKPGSDMAATTTVSISITAASEIINPPITGDNSNMTIWFWICGAAAFGLGVLIVMRQYRKNTVQ